jgi:hypothetical protein
MHTKGSELKPFSKKYKVFVTRMIADAVKDNEMSEGSAEPLTDLIKIDKCRESCIFFFFSFPDKTTERFEVSWQHLLAKGAVNNPMN